MYRWFTFHVAVVPNWKWDPLLFALFLLLPFYISRCCCSNLIGNSQFSTHQWLQRGKHTKKQSSHRSSFRPKRIVKGFSFIARCCHHWSDSIGMLFCWRIFALNSPFLRQPMTHTDTHTILNRPSTVVTCNNKRESPKGKDEERAEQKCIHQSLSIVSLSVRFPSGCAAV